MSAKKRNPDGTFRKSPAGKRRAPESLNETSADSETRKLLKECSKKQRKYISRMKKFLTRQLSRFSRLRDHVNYHLKIERNSISIRHSVEEQIKEYEKELTGLNRQEALLRMMMKDEQEQEDKLETILQKVSEYKGYELRGVRTRETGIPSNPYGPFEEDFNDALRKVPAITRNDAEMELVTKLKKGDMGYIVWPRNTENWSQYSVHWDSGFEEADECKKLDETIQILEAKLAEEKTDYEEFDSRRSIIIIYDEKRNCPVHNDRIRNLECTDRTKQLEQLIQKSFGMKVSIEKLKVQQKSLETSKKEREDLMKTIQKDMNAEALKCSVCFEALTNGEQSVHCPQLFGSCGHTVCASCMQHFKARHSPYHWTCHQCRAPSDKVLTNWALMQLIKETPGQPQRAVVDAPQAVPIVPAPWRLEQRRDREPAAAGADDGPFGGIANRMMRVFFDQIENRQAERAEAAQAAAALAPVAQDPPAQAPAAPYVGLAIPPLPPAALQAAPAPQAALIDDDDELEVLEVHIRAPPRVRVPAVRPEQIDEDIIVLD